MSYARLLDFVPDGNTVRFVHFTVLSEIKRIRRIAASEIAGFAALPRVIGWRYAPSVKNKPLRLCDCLACLHRGEVKAARNRDRIRAEMRRLGQPSNA